MIRYAHAPETVLGHRSVSRPAKIRHGEAGLPRDQVIIGGPVQAGGAGENPIVSVTGRAEQSSEEIVECHCQARVRLPIDHRRHFIGLIEPA